MKWLPKDKRNPFILVVAITAAVLMLIYFGLLSSQRSVIKRVGDSRNAATTQLKSIEKTIVDAEQTANELVAVTDALEQAEKDMATGDLYSWAYSTIRTFKQPYKIEIPEIGQPTEGDVEFSSSFPYKQMRFMVSGKGHYHELGKFISGLENKFAYVRVANLIIDSTSNDAEKLSFRMEIIALIKPNNP